MTDDGLAALRDSIAALQPITLAAVEERAGLQTRVDRKYVVPMAMVSRLVTANASDLVSLEIDGRREFGYSSEYWDTTDRRCYRDAAGGRRRRFKVRTRSYEGDPTVRLEVKTRGRRSTTAKMGIELARGADLADALSGPGADFVAEQLRGIGIDPSDVVEHLEPVVTIDYRRSTLVHTSRPERITVDQSLRFAADGQPARTLDGFAIVETKSTAGPTAVDRWLWRRGARPDRISKYAVAMAVLDPTLGGHKWARVLRDHFDRSAPGVRA